MNKNSKAKTNKKCPDKLPSMEFPKVPKYFIKSV